MVGETFRPDIWYYGVLWLGMSVPGLIWLAGTLLLTTRTGSNCVSPRRTVRLLLVLYAPMWLVQVNSEVSHGLLEIGRTLGLGASILLGALSCFVLLAVAELMLLVPHRWLRWSGRALIWLVIPCVVLGSFFSVVSLCQTICNSEPRPPYAYEAYEVDANRMPVVRNGSMTIQYIVVDETWAMTRAATVPASLLLPPRQWPQWVTDLSIAASGRLSTLDRVLDGVSEAAMGVYMALAGWQLHGAAKRRAALDPA
jgi:hypothetical protein